MWEVYAQKQKANSDFPNIYRWLQKMCRESQDITIARITEIDLKKKKIPKCFQHLSKKFWTGSSSTFGQVEQEEKNAVHCFLKPKVIPVNKNTPWYRRNVTKCIGCWAVEVKAVQS